METIEKIVSEINTMQHEEVKKKKKRRRKKNTHTELTTPPVEVLDVAPTEQTHNKKRRRKKTTEKEKPVPKKIYTPFELFYDEGLSKSGWAGLLHPLYKEVERWNKDNEHNFQFTQIKEKFGSLNLYNFGATEEQWERINMCEKASNQICMLCGSPFNVGKTKSGWITTMCERCAKDEQILIDWTPKYTSIRISNVIKIALKIQKLEFYLKNKCNKISYMFYKYRGYIKFTFVHYILRSDKLDKTLFNYLKY